MPTAFPIGFAHRGASAHARENTLEAFRLALAMGATGLESDVWITADGVPVLDHDGELDGRPFATVPRAELPAHIPALAELYGACGRDVPLSLDVKDAAAAPAVVEVAREHGGLEALWLCHWSWKTVASWRPLSDALHLVDSTRARHMRTLPEPRARRMAELGIDAINLHHGDWSPDWIRIFQRHGRRAFAWDAQDDATLSRLLGWGVDAVYGDHVDRIVRQLEMRTAGPPSTRR